MVAFLDSMMQNFVHKVTMDYNNYIDIVVVVVDNTIVYLQLIRIEITETKAFFMVWIWWSIEEIMAIKTTSVNIALFIILMLSIFIENVMIYSLTFSIFFSVHSCNRKQIGFHIKSMTYITVVLFFFISMKIDTDRCQFIFITKVIGSSKKNTWMWKPDFWKVLYRRLEINLIIRYID